MIRVREVTHHGSFRNVRYVPMAEPTEAEVGVMLASGPYPVIAPYLSGAAAKVAADLAATGEAQHGWVTYYAEDSEEETL